MTDTRFAATLLLLLVGLSTWLAFGVIDRQTWVLENVLLVAFVVTLVVAFPRFRFSRRSSLFIFAFLSLHAVGAHYTYSLVPYDEWCRLLTGTTVSELTGWSRNHYDRLLHFLFGLLLAVPAREWLIRVATVPPHWSFRLAVVVILAASGFYELIEWAAAIVFGGELGVRYLGTQGDEWDSQRDMALALLGAVVAMGCAAAGVRLSAGVAGRRLDRLVRPGRRGQNRRRVS